MPALVSPALLNGHPTSPVLLDLPGPSRRVRVEPVELPIPARPPEPAPAPEPAPEPARAPAPTPERDPVPA